jgi:hypothetical protein
MRCIYKNAQFQKTLEWEGTNVDEGPYRLKLKKGCRFFNGKNGELRDGDGEIIVCYLKPETQSRRVVHDLPAYFIDRITAGTAAAAAAVNDDHNSNNNNNLMGGDGDTATVVEEQSRSKRLKLDNE